MQQTALLWLCSYLTWVLLASANQSTNPTAKEVLNLALEIRKQPNPSWQEQRRCVAMLMLAAGLEHKEHHISGVPVPIELLQLDPEVNGTPILGHPKLEMLPYGEKAALRELAKAVMEGYGVDADARLALALFSRAADLGDPEAQGQMGVRYALGVHRLEAWEAHGIVEFGEPDEAAALLHYYWGAGGGDAVSAMALGYRHTYGLGVPKSCWSATAYYEPVAQQVADLAAGTTLDRLPQIERLRLSVAAGQGSRADRQREVVQYYQDSADKGNVDAQTAVGQVLNYGTHGVARDHAAARHYLQRAVEAGDVPAMAHLGHMAANGLGGPVDYEAALKHFQQASRSGNPSAHFGLGFMYLSGLGVAQDYDKAFKMFSQAAEQSHPDAHFFMGVMHLKGLGVRRKSVQRAFSYFTLASHSGHVQAMYNAAMLHMAGRGTPRSCRPAASLLKMAAERGPTAAALQHGHEAFFRGEYSDALWSYLVASELGMEVGASNAAWLLQRGYVSAGGRGRGRNATFGLLQRSAEQGNVASLLSMADAYFYGDGVEQDWGRAAAIYYEAYQERSPEAMWDLGFMHQFGAGVPKDLRLAHRFYDMAMHTSKDARLAVWVSRAWLAVHRVWDEVVRPRLPQAYAHIWDRVMALEAPHTSVLGPWTGVVAQLLPGREVIQLELGLWRVMDALGITSLVSAVMDNKDGGETLLLLAAAGLLMVVLRMRAVRARAAQAFGVNGEEARRRQALAQEITEEGLRAVAERRRQREASMSGGGAAEGQASGAGGRAEAQEVPQAAG